MNETIGEKASRIKKLLVFLAFCAAEAINEGLVPERLEGWVRIGLAAATAYGIYQAKNAPPARPQVLADPPPGR
jgi:hypothetical protein